MVSASGRALVVGNGSTATAGVFTPGSNKIAAAFGNGIVGANIGTPLGDPPRRPPLWQCERRFGEVAALAWIFRETQCDTVLD
jgi:hypothetical protein